MIRGIARVQQLARRLRTQLAPRKHRLLFAFAGASGGWPGLSGELYRDSRVFRDSIDATSSIVEQVLGWSAGTAAFRGGEDPGDTPELSRRNEIIRQGMVQIGLTDIRRAEGITPDGVIGVSLGEMVAPYAAGAISRDDCARILAVVSQAISRVRSYERMYLLSTDAHATQRLCRNAPAPVDFLGSSSRAISVALAPEEHTEVLRAYFGGAIVRDLLTDWSYHTPRLDVDRPWMQEQLRGVVSRTPDCPIYSAAAGGAIPPNTPFDAQFFAWMVSHSFHFANAVAAALHDGFDAILHLAAKQSNVTTNIAETARAERRDVRLIESITVDERGEHWRPARAELQRLRRRPAADPAISPRTLDLGDPAVAANAFHVYEELRRGGSVHFLTRHDSWIVLGYDDVQRALAQPNVFAPNHTAIRSIAEKHFTSDATTRCATIAEQVAGRLLQPLVAGKELDVVHGFGDPLADAIGSEITGLDEEAIATFADATFEAGGDSERLYRELEEPVAAVAHRSTLYESLLRDGVDEAGARSLLRLFWIASTAELERLIPLSILLLLENDAVRARLTEETDLLGAFVDEALRLRPPEHMIPRIATEDTELGGAKIPAGTLVQLCIAAANRDPLRFEQPATLRLDRSPNAHLAFGGGIHRCIGAPIARETTIAALRTLFGLVPDFRTFQPLGTLRYARQASLRKLEQLVIGR